MTFLRAQRLAHLLSIGADDATIAKEGFTELQIADARLRFESAQRVAEILRRHEG